MTQYKDKESKLTSGQDYYLDESGLMVLTAKFLLKRGFCCGSGCKHCPYEESTLINPYIPRELQIPQQESLDQINENSLSEYSDFYEDE